jgi:hypothetical protein
MKGYLIRLVSAEIKREEKSIKAIDNFSEEVQKDKYWIGRRNGAEKRISLGNRTIQFLESGGDKQRLPLWIAFQVVLSTKYLML